MPKLYIFGIGGTGSRVIKSLTMLFASGVTLPNGFTTVVPIIIDPDTANGDLNRTQDILTKYQEIRSKVNKPSDFFSQNIRTIDNIANNNNNINSRNFQFNLNGVNQQTFGEYIGFGTLSNNAQQNQDDQAFIDLLYSNANLNSNLNVGFKGNPNMGSIVLNQFTNSNDFNTFAQTFVPGDAIFIVNSIFGGTGAAGFPLLLKNLRSNNILPGAININDAPIGGLTFLPYFTLTQAAEVDSGTFLEKSKIALDYYNRTIISQNRINAIHFIGDSTNNNIQQYAVGGQNQTNNAHFLEIAASLSIIDFCKNIGNYSNINGVAVNDTTVKEYGIQNDNTTLTFSDLDANDIALIQKPLSKYYSFAEYLNNEDGLNKAIKYSRWTRGDIKCVKKHKQSPCDKNYFNSSDFKNDILGFNGYFKEWITELSQNNPAFNPFNKQVPAKLYKAIDQNNGLLIEDFVKEATTSHKHSTLINMLGMSIEKAVDKLPIRTNEVTNSKVYRIHSGAQGTGWFASAAFNRNQLDTIKTDGKAVASSIPSPFAQIDLVKSAFEWINFQVSQIVGSNPTLTNQDRTNIVNIINGNTAQNQLISQAFDIGQVFFKYPALKNRFDIIAWNPANRFAANINGNNSNNQLLFATLNTFWQQDQSTDGRKLYNFEYTQDLFFIVNKLTRKVIGGTSPATLFFAAPDAQNNLGGFQIPVGTNSILSGNSIALNNRDATYIEYIYALSKQANFAIRYPEVDQYLRYVNQFILTDGIKQLINNANINNYNSPTVTNNPNFPLDVIGYRLGVEKSIFQDKIIILPYDIDDNSYQTAGNPRFLLPITEAFLRKYTINSVANCNIKILPSGAVDVSFEVPNNDGEQVTFQKTYGKNNIINLTIHLAIVPFLQTNNFNIDYTVGLLDTRLDGKVKLDLKFFDENGNNIPITGQSVRRERINVGDFRSVFYKTSSVKAIKIEYGNSSGFIIPNLPTKMTNNQVSFAIDFGTTNSHIEYRVDGGGTVPFDTQDSADSYLWKTLLDRKLKVNPVILANDRGFDEEILPLVMNNQIEKVFPVRTAIAYNKGVNFNQTFQHLLHTNNYLFYEKRSNITSEIKSNLKWSNYNDDNFTMLVNSYIEGLLQTVLYKTLMLDANPNTTQITWFYPVSMSQFEQGVFKNAWQKSYMSVFKVNNTNNLYSVPESIAPYLHYRGTDYAGASLSIDIGGGSSDIAFFENASDKPNFISSIKFAGNAIFGDGFADTALGGSTDNNGYVKAFKDKVTNILSGNTNKKSVLDVILNKRKSSSDFSSFLFSLDGDSDIAFNYTEELSKHSRLKLPILIFHSAVIYYSSKLIALQEVSMPKNILYSGTASKTLNILDKSIGYSNISNLYRHIIEKVSGKNINTLKIVLDREPKELTCKGALRGNLNASIDTIPIHFWLGGKGYGVWSSIISGSEKLHNTPKYKDLKDKDNNVIGFIKNSIEDFYKILDEYIHSINLNNIFGIELQSYDTFKKMRSDDIENFIEFGIKAFYHSDDNHIEETIFFYPLIGVLNKLAIDLSRNSN